MERNDEKGKEEIFTWTRTVRRTTSVDHLRACGDAESDDEGQGEERARQRGPRACARLTCPPAFLTHPDRHGQHPGQARVRACVRPPNAQRTLGRGAPHRRHAQGLRPTPHAHRQRPARPMLTPSRPVYNTGQRNCDARQLGLQGGPGSPTHVSRKARRLPKQRVRPWPPCTRRRQQAFARRYTCVPAQPSPFPTPLPIPHPRPALTQP